MKPPLSRRFMWFSSFLGVLGALSEKTVFFARLAVLAGVRKPGGRSSGSRLEKKSNISRQARKERQENKNKIRTRRETVARPSVHCGCSGFLGALGEKTVFARYLSVVAGDRNPLGTHDGTDAANSA